ncbi:hypothetical protein BU15DRAFT_48324, partial [Melanogaster broomeanus]
MITDEDRDNIRAYQLKIMSNMPRRVFNRMRYAFQHKMDIDSKWVILHRLAVLAGVDPEIYHCCVNSCIAYTLKYIHHESCPFCKEPRYGKGSHPRRVFYYIPLIPRLRAFFQNTEMIQKLSYRSSFHHHEGLIQDVFNGAWYRTLLNRKVVVDGVEHDHKYFSGKHDLAFSLAIDGFLLFD